MTRVTDYSRASLCARPKHEARGTAATHQATPGLWLHSLMFDDDVIIFILVSGHRVQSGKCIYNFRSAVR